MNIDTHNKITRGEFLSIAGGALVSLFLLKFDSAKQLTAGVLKNKQGAYGNTVYGGTQKS